jgi:hypothetical protein
MSLRPMTIARRLAHDGVLAVSTRSLRRPKITRPEALAVASPGQAQLQIFDLALIPIVGNHPRINHMKLNEHTRRLFLSSSVRIARSNFFSLFLIFLHCVTTCDIMDSLSLLLYTAEHRAKANLTRQKTPRPTLDRLKLLVLNLHGQT